MSYKILVVCMGNICRSPTMEAVLKHKTLDNHHIHIESAGTIDYHQGNAPDPRSITAGERRGYSFDNIVSRQIVHQDFLEFDLILCADKSNKEDLIALCPLEHQHKLHLFLEFGRQSTKEVPDPYYGGSSGFEKVLDLIEQASDEIIKQLT